MQCCTLGAGCSKATLALPSVKIINLKPAVLVYVFLHVCLFQNIIEETPADSDKISKEISSNL
jgi:hypothetical protein